MKVALAADHGGYRAKELTKEFLKELGHEWIDLGTESEESVDYPDFGFAAAEAVARRECDRAILFCKSGIGMEIAANKVEGVRAANCLTRELARLSRAHNDANALSIPSQFLQEAEMKEIIRVWLETSFEGGRHARRVEKLTKKDSL